MKSQTRWFEFRSSFQFKLFLIFTLITFLIGTLLTALYISKEIEAASLETKVHLQLRVENMVDAIRLPLYAHNMDALRELAEQLAKAPEILSVMISAPDGRVLVKVQRNAEREFPPPKSILHKTEIRTNPLATSVDEGLTDRDGKATSLLGRVEVIRSTEDLSLKIRNVVNLSITAAIIFWLTVSFLSFLVLQRLTRSFNSLMQGILNMMEGDFTKRIAIESDDEPGRAARAVNSLAEMLQLRGEENLRLQAERLETERKMLQAQKLESLGVMAGGVAHDFNNLLQSILGNMELATLKLDPDAAPRKYIDNAVSSAKRAALLTGLMLTYVGKGVITRKELDLNELVLENSDLLQTATSTAVTNEFHLAPELPFIMADTAHIQQLVMNLITNAAEAITRQDGIVRLTTGVNDFDQAFLNASLLEEKPAAGRYVFLEVSDNGCGMSEETLKRLFDPFFTTKFTGRGLGMSAVLGIMKTHRGALFVESKEGSGTTFTALFPISATERRSSIQAVKVTVPAEVVAGEKALSGVALVVDDEKAVLKVCSRMVSLCGFKVITARDGFDAVAKFREHADEITLVLLDLTMPRMDGIAAMNEILDIRPETKVLLASGFSEDEMSERVTERPPSGFIRKPYDMAQLEAEIRRVLQNEG